MVIWKYKIKGFLLMIFFVQQVTAQYTVHFVATVAKDKGDVFLTGSFNNWDPGDTTYKLIKTSNNQYQITLSNLKAGRYQYRFTRGTAITLECTAAGINIEPRQLMLEKDTTVQIKIAAWLDMYFDMTNLPDSVLNEAMMTRAGYWMQTNMDSSYKYANQVYLLSKKLHLPMKEARALDLQSHIFSRQGNAAKALEMLLKSLALKQSLHDSSGGTSFTYTSIGKIYESMQDFNNARENYQQAAQWLNKQNEIFKSYSLTDIGNLFFKENNIDSATSYAEKALAINSSYYGALLLTGDIELKKGRFKEALQNYKAACIASTRGTPGTALYRSPTEAYKKTAIVFDRIGQRDSAFYYARKAFNVASKENNPADIISASAVLIDLFKTYQRYDSAFSYQQLLLQKKDSLFTVEKNQQIHNIYFNERLRQQELKASNEKNSAQVKIYVLAGLAALLLFIGIGYRIRVKNRFDKQLAEIEMRALRAQMNPHFIFNCLASINRYIVKSDTKTASAYLTKFSKLIRLILDNSSSELVNIDAEIQTLKLYLDMESLRFDDSFEYEIVKDQLVRSDNSAIPAMIIQPYIENAIWHGLLHISDEHLGKGKKGKLWLRFLPLNDNGLQVEIEDNGIGRKKASEMRSKDTMKTKSYGMQISKDRIELINSQYQTRSSVTIQDLTDEAGNPSGTKVILQLPIIEMAIHPDTIKKAV